MISGFGEVDESQLYHGNEHTITLFSEGELKLDDFHIFEIPISRSFKFTNADRGVTIALAYNPYVQYRRQYRAIKMDFVYIYDRASITDIIEKFNKLQSNEVDTDNLLKSESQNHFQVDVSSTIRNNSTLQVDNTR
jgi:hypothetical protein